MKKMKDCPFCKLSQGLTGENLITQAEEIIYQDEDTTAFIACDWWPNNRGSVIVISNQHFDNLYSVPNRQLGKAYTTVKKIAKAIKMTYKCDGISTRQHNEAAGSQTVFHFHIHIFPRYLNDNLYLTDDQWFRAPIKDRLKYAKKLKSYLS